LQQSPYKNLQWRLAGPDNISGRSTDVVGITGNSNIIYAAFATGGLWKTEDGGETWKSLFDQEATLSIGNIALAPSDKNILYVGTGEANISVHRCPALVYINLLMPEKVLRIPVWKKPEQSPG
jgi:hypothetical protein